MSGPASQMRLQVVLSSEAKERCMKVNHNGNRIDTTLGVLIATVSDLAFEYSADANKAYNVAHLVLVEILKGASLGREIVDRHVPTGKYLH